MLIRLVFAAADDVFRHVAPWCVRRRLARLRLPVTPLSASRAWNHCGRGGRTNPTRHEGRNAVRQTTDTYTCDRCCGQQVQNHGTSAPLQWWRLMLTRPLLASPLEAVHANTIDKHLCGECSNFLRAWLSGDDAIQEVSA